MRSSKALQIIGPVFQNLKIPMRYRLLQAKSNAFCFPNSFFSSKYRLSFTMLLSGIVKKHRGNLEQPANTPNLLCFKISFPEPHSGHCPPISSIKHFLRSVFLDIPFQGFQDFQKISESLIIGFGQSYSFVGRVQEIIPLGY